MFKITLKKNDIPKDGELFRKAAFRTLNRVSKSAEAFAIRKIKESYNVPRATVDRDISVRPASITNLKAGIYVADKPIPLIEFGARQVRPGVSVAILKTNRKVVPGVFTATMPSGHIGVFARSGVNAHRVAKQSGGRKYLSELPIKELRSVMTVARMFKSRRVLPELEKHIEERLDVEYPHQLAYLTQGGKT